MENWRKQAPSRAEEGQPFEPVFHFETYIYLSLKNPRFFEQRKYLLRSKI